MVRENSDIKCTRRSYTKHFKRDVVAQCGQPGQSISGIALKHNMNANIVHKWVRLAQAGELAEPVPTFIPIPIAAKEVLTGNAQTIDIEVVRGETKMQIRWPTRDGVACSAWMLDLLR